MGMFGPIDLERKGNASFIYWVNYMSLTFDLTHGFDLGFPRYNFEITEPQDFLVKLMWNKKKWINKRLYWLDGIARWIHTSLWSWSFKVRVWNSLISGMDGPVDMVLVAHSWPWCWPMRDPYGVAGCTVVTGVTSDVSVPPAYLV